MHNLKLWSSPNISNNLTKFVDSIKDNLRFNSYIDLHKWSVQYKNEFWTEIWKFTKIIGDLKGESYLHNDDFVKCKFLNFVQIFREFIF